MPPIPAAPYVRTCPRSSSRAMEKPAPGLIASRLTAEERVLLFCIASGTDWTRVGLSSVPTRNLIVKDLVEHDRKTMRLVLTKTGRGVLQFLLGNSGIKWEAPGS
jgi:hypothetical protein